jgi:subtilisin family serine protease
LKDAIALANTAEILFIASAGNGGGPLCNDGNANNNDLSPCYPASFNLPNIISVAATDQNDRIASFSNYGLTSVHVAAPGVYILSTIPQDMYADKDFNWGTSMAAPHVSGLVGLLYSYYDGSRNILFDYSQVHNTILRCVNKEETLDGWIQTGGRINAYKAVGSLAIPTDLTASATSPNQVSLTWSANATCNDGYKVERKTGEGNWGVLGNTLPNSSSYNDDTVSPDTTYTYRVTAVNNIAESFPSNEVGITTPKPESSSGGGGCTIGAKQNTPTAVADTTMLLIPLLAMAFLRRRR